MGSGVHLQASLTVACCGTFPLHAVQHESIPQAMLGMHVLCQAKSGMGKTAVFVLAVLQQLEPQPNPTGPSCLVLCHTRELAFQVSPSHSSLLRVKDGNAIALASVLRPVLSLVGLSSSACCEYRMGLQIMKDFKRFSKYMKDVVCTVVFGGINLKTQKDELKQSPPHVVVGTPGRVKQV